MTLDEAIKMFEENADECQRVADTQELGDGHYVSELYCDDTDAINNHLERCRIQATEYRQLAEWLKELKSLKEKDEAKAVRYEGDGYADGAMVYDMALCPNCEHVFEEDSENWECDFCPNCGQKLRWE
jgi:rubrerythrin